MCDVEVILLRHFLPLRILFQVIRHENSNYKMYLSWIFWDLLTSIEGGKISVHYFEFLVISTKHVLKNV